MTSTSTLKSLAHLILASVDEIEGVCTKKGVAFPELDTPFTLDSEAIRMDPNVLKATSVAVAAASQLIETVRAPMMSIMCHGMSLSTPASLGTLNQLNVAEIIGRAGPHGIHVTEIGAKTNTDPQKIGSLLRLLATQHIFKEVSPDVYAHNRISSLLDTGKTYEEVSKDPLTKYTSPSSVGSAFVMQVHMQLATVPYLYEHLTDPKTAFSGEPTQTLANRAFKFDTTAWEWMEKEENKLAATCLATLMAGITKMQPDEAITHGFDFGGLPKDSLVVDVGGNLGSVSMVLAKKYSHLRFVIQDRASVVPEGVKHWEANFPQGLEGNRTTFMVHDFLTPQPTLPAAPAVFILRRIAHDWSDIYLARIYRHLRDAAGNSRETRLVVIDAVLPYACASLGDGEGVKGVTKPSVPAPLLPNLGAAAFHEYAADFMMMTMLNASERTLVQHSAVLRAGGWKLVECIQAHGHEMWHPHLVAELIFE